MKTAAREPGGWQAQKSVATRQLIVEATLRCLVELGLRRTTTHAIATQAGLSRGALLHHFPAKADALRAAAGLLYRNRLQLLARRLEARTPGGPERSHALVESLWQHCRDGSFAGVLELELAARTDRALAAVLAPAREAYAHDWRHAVRSALPATVGSGVVTDPALDALRAALEGLALARAAGGSDAPAAVLRELERLLSFGR